MRIVLGLILAIGFIAGCNPVDRSVRAWIESRDPKGNIVAGCTVEIDGQAVGMTDGRGLYRVKIRRRARTPRTRRGVRRARSAADRGADADRRA